MTARALAFLISVVLLIGLVFGMVAVTGAEPKPTRDDPWASVPVWPKPTDHAAFFPEPLPDGPSVTRACLQCHPDAARQMMETTHWTWEGAEATDPRTGEVESFGKRNLQNNFCIAISANWPRCTSCHAGYGWNDDTFLQGATEELVDCLVCHDASGQYEKGAAGAGLPKPGVDLKLAAQSVGRTSRASCGVCHFKGGGGDGVKHGDLDETMYFPPERVDVHMGKHDLRCADCHQATEHHIKGRLLPPDDKPGTRVSCTDCHDAAPHAQDRLNIHVEALACQTCHIPSYAVETGTKLWWDWSKAGRDGDPHEIAERLAEEMANAPDGIPAAVAEGFERVGKDPNYHAHYNKKKGLFLVARDVAPEYRWYNSTTKRYLPGERYEGKPPLVINRPLGEASDPKAKIWPFKVHRGIQPFDLRHRHLLNLHTFGEGGYWNEFDWEKALKAAAGASGVAYSGERGWMLTEMYWPQNHMVQSKQETLGCVDCHGDGGRMDWASLGYPGDPAFTGNRRQMDVLREEGK